MESYVRCFFFVAHYSSHVYGHLEGDPSTAGIEDLLLMAEILHHLECLKPCK